jgi:alpha-L-rhamnosidase
MAQILVPLLLAANALTNPMGVQDPAPRLSWQLQADSSRRGAVQSAYEIRVSSAPGGPSDFWDSGRVPSAESIQIPYGGKPLPSRTRAYWQVTVWDERGASSSSAPGAAFWETGLLDRSDWSAKWIGASWHGSASAGAPAPYLRKTFTLASAPARARLYISALGIYEAYLNGRRVGDGHFTPGWTDYRKRVQYQVYDVTALLAEGDNAIGAVLGDGWYCGHVGWRDREVYGDRPKLLAQLEVTLADGSRQVVSSDGSWRAASGPTLDDDLLMGETFDAQKELRGWNRPGPESGSWDDAAVFPDPGIELSPSLDRPITNHGDVRAVAEPRMADGHRFIYDFGQNLVGVATLRIRAPAGTVVTLHYAEMLDPAGNLYLDNLRKARATDSYACKGAADGESWTPRFTYHGFRYAEIDGLPDSVEADRGALVAHVLHSDMGPSGDFTCSDPLVNQLQHNIQWSQRGNYFGVPTDCPQRDERLGWTGDAQAFIRTGAWNRDVEAFFTKWQRDIADAQAPAGYVPAVIPSIEIAPVVPGDGGPGWADAAIICPWTVYLCYGDRALLETHFGELRNYVDYLATQSVGHIRLDPSLKKWGGFGDWLALDGSGKTDGGTPKDLIATAFYAHDAHLLSAMAAVLGRTADAATYAALETDVKRAFQERYLSADGLMAGDTQTAYVLPLEFDLVPEEVRPLLADRLVRDIRARGMKLSTGFIGTPYLLHVLAREGHLDVAYALLAQKAWPSWLYPVTQGATTIWERWDGWTADKGFEDKGMNSFNHYAYGAVGDWLYRVVAGIEIDPLRPAYKHVVLRPRPGGTLTSASASHLSPYGTVASSWKLGAGRFDWDVTVPVNTTATATFPVPPGTRITEGASDLARAGGVSGVQGAADSVTCELASGTYHFRALLPN